MWRTKKFIVGTVLATVLLVGSIGVVAVAADNGDDSQPGAQHEALLDKVCEIYNANPETSYDIDCEALEAAFAQARSEMREAALDNRLQKLVDEGKIEPDQVTAYKEWLQATPDMQPFRQQLSEWQQARPGIPPELGEWQQARPDVPFRFGFKGRGGFRGMGGMRGFGGPCAPAE